MHKRVDEALETPSPSLFFGGGGSAALSEVVHRIYATLRLYDGTLGLFLLFWGGIFALNPGSIENRAGFERPTLWSSARMWSRNIPSASLSLGVPLTDG